MKRALFLLFVVPTFCFGQYTHIVDSAKATYQNTQFHEVMDYASKKSKATKPKNIIILIGDGMGTSQVYAGLIANKGSLYLRTMPVSGFSKTNSADDLITDSAAGATAISAGVKTNNGAIGVDRNDLPKKTLFELAEEKKLSTGLVVSCAVTHATPAAFVAHQSGREMTQAIAADFMNSGIDVFIGGGRDDFEKRKDGRNLLAELKTKGYDVIGNIDSLPLTTGSQVAALVHKNQPEPYALGRGELLKPATAFALNKLNENKHGFMLLVEGSQIDWGGHDNHTGYIVTEMLDFDRTLGEVLKFASKDGETLVVVTADHETGGFSINGGSLETGLVEGKFTTGSHTGVMVPIFAYGPGAEQFSGIMENTDIFLKIKKVMGL
ncbi:MAG: alkaline phosphatase [Cyclobacteriaceae bacterium]|nr:alkaline phosphatase [Cyclobacteriaceae bacterium]